MTAPKTAGEIAEGLSEEERKLLTKLAAGHLWPLGAQPGCASALYRKGLTTSNGEFVPMRASSMGHTVAQELQKRG